MNARRFARLHQAQIRSGQSIAAFCRKRGLALSSFHYWRRRYGSTAAEGGFVEVHLSESSRPLRPSLPTSPDVVESPPLGLHYRGVHVSLPVGFSPSTLRQCLEVLRETLPC